MAIVRKSTLPDASLPIPAGFYNLAIVKAEHKKAASSNADMLVLELQIVSPAEVQTEGRTIKTAGKKSTHRVVLTEKGNVWVKEIEQLTGDVLPEELDTEVVAKAAAEALAPNGENGILYLCNVELKPAPYYETDPVTRKEVIGADGQKKIKGWSFERAGREWPKAVTEAVAAQM